MQTKLMLLFVTLWAVACDSNNQNECDQDGDCGADSMCIASTCFHPTSECESGWRLSNNDCSPTPPRADVGGADTRHKDTVTEDVGGANRDVGEAGSDAEPDTDPIEPKPLKAFPNAYGAGAEATGGRGGVLVIVNTPDVDAELAHFPATDTAPERYEGGLYAALQLDRPAYIIFDRSMVITQPTGGTTGAFSARGIPHVRNKTIFGQSAPRGGVTLTGGTLRFDGQTSEVRNLIFRYFRSRPVRNRDGNLSVDDDRHTWAMLFYGGKQIIVDHCSFSFAHDKALGGSIDQNVVPEHVLEDHTYSRNLMTDSHTGLYVAVNPDRPEDPEKYVDRMSFLENVTLGVNRTPNAAFDGYAEVIGNVAYDIPTKAITTYHDVKLNHIGNTYLRPDGRTDTGFNRIFEYDDSAPRIYSAGNVFSGIIDTPQRGPDLAIWKYMDNYDAPVSSEFFVDDQFTSTIRHKFPIPSADETFADLISDGNVGANRYLDDDGRPQLYQDDHDVERLERVRRGDRVPNKEIERWVLPSLPNNVRPATYDTDFDGLSDAWERRVFGDLSESYAGDHDNDGYTNIEEYMNQVDE